MSLPTVSLARAGKDILKNKTTLAYTALAIGILFLSFSAIFVRWANAPGVVTSFYRMAIAAVVMSPVLVRQGLARQARMGLSSSAPPTGTARGAQLKWAWLLPAGLGGLFTALDHGTWSTSIGLTAVANATLLNNTAPVWVALVAYFIFREKLKRYFWVGLMLAIAGATAVLAGDLIARPSLSWGDGLALVSGMFYAGYFLITQRARRSMSAFTYMAVVDLVSAACLLIFCLAFRQPLGGYPLQTYLIFVAAALVAQVAGHLSLSYALGHLPAFLVAPTMIAQPVLTALLAIPLLGEGLRPSQLAGGLAVLAGIYLVNRSQN